MSRAMVLILACSMLLFTANLAEGNIAGLGVNWGHMGSHNLQPSIVAKLLKDNGINKFKLFDADPSIVKGFAGTGIEVMLGIPNGQLAQFSDSLDNAKRWVKENVTQYLKDGGVNIKYVGVGNEAFLTSYNGSYINSTFPAIQNMQKALNAAGLGGKIKVTTPLNADVAVSLTGGPSGGEFRYDIKDHMVEIVKFLQANKSPFVVNIYPFINLYQDPGYPFEFAFFNGSGKPVDDNGLIYTNAIEGNYDTLAWALKKAGVPDLKIVIGEVGWPTDGAKYANVTLAKRFYDGLLQKMASKTGTPLRPDQPIEAYLFSILDEDLKSILPGNFERHWGIFRYDGQPKFPMDLTGKGEKLPVAAEGVEYMPEQWCVFNKDNSNKTQVAQNFNYACLNTDCTSLEYGGTCDTLDDNGKVSYAFNMYYQSNDQQKAACHFDGLATVVKQNASQGTCLFPVQIATARASTPPAPAPALAPASTNATASTSANATTSGKAPASASAGRRLDVVFGTSVVGGLLILFTLF
uniref:glucan endo-1,3-beta-D-glucosidase n=1 Tax=Davidia involucrata TaxID=16924 RepID=A0A5B6YPR4_DAVIN